MSRTFKDKPYRVLEREALEHGYTYLRHNWMHPTEPPTVEGDVAAYAYSQSRKAHIPSAGAGTAGMTTRMTGIRITWAAIRFAIVAVSPCARRIPASWTTIGTIPACTVAASNGNAD